MKPLINGTELVSVVIAVLNNKDGFENAVNSVLQQPYQVEIIVIDGGSTDGTLAKVGTFSEEIAYWESGQDNGIADAFNRGVKHCTGSLIAILNSDDFWAQNTLELLAIEFNRQPDADLYCGGVNYIDVDRGYQYVRLPNLTRLKKKMYVFHPAMFVKSVCYQQVGNYDLLFTNAMDAEWVHRAISKKQRFATINKVLANMSLGGVSDKEFRTSLIQYRDSLIKNKLSGRFEANYHYFFHLVQKKMMSLLPLNFFKRVRDQNISNRIT